MQAIPLSCLRMTVGADLVLREQRLIVVPRQPIEDGENRHIVGVWVAIKRLAEYVKSRDDTDRPPLLSSQSEEMMRDKGVDNEGRDPGSL